MYQIFRYQSQSDATGITQFSGLVFLSSSGTCAGEQKLPIPLVLNCLRRHMKRESSLITKAPQLWQTCSFFPNSIQSILFLAWISLHCSNQKRHSNFISDVVPFLLFSSSCRRSDDAFCCHCTFVLRSLHCHFLLSGDS